MIRKEEKMRRLVKYAPVLVVSAAASLVAAQNTPVDLGTIEFPISPASIVAAVFAAVGTLWASIYAFMIAARFIRRVLHRMGSTA